MEPANSNRLLVIIVTYNALRWIERCLCSLEESSVQCDVFILDNGSTDGTREYLASHPQKNVFVHHSSENGGFGAGNNEGLRFAREKGYDWIYLLNQDAWVEKDCFRNLIAAAENNPDYGILSPLQLQSDYKTPDRLFAKHCGGSILSCSGAEVVQVRFVMAAHWLISAKCLEKTGGFSPTFTQYGEDENYIDRARWWGFKVGVVPMAKAVHDRAQRVSSRASQMRLKYVGCVARLSNPALRCPYLHLLLECCRIAGMSIRRLSLTMLSYLPSLVRQMPRIQSNRRVSMTPGAFL